MEQMYVSGHTMEMLISSGFSKNAKIDHRKKIFIQKTNIWCKMAGWTNVHPGHCSFGGGVFADIKHLLVYNFHWQK